jgi:GTP pyrophosphokinase
MNEITIYDLISKLNNYSDYEINMILKAYKFAEYLHKGQMRQSGEEYIIHPLNVAYILADMNADADTICAGLLHDTLEDTNISKEEIAENFNDDVAVLVEGVTKISKMNFSTKKEQNMANTRKIITSITDDVRIIIIKLADRLHNMRTLSFKSEIKQKENALETLEIFTPLAYYIGNYRIKSELEDLSFMYLMRDKYDEIVEKRNIIEEENKECLLEMLKTIEEVLCDKEIPNEIKIRTKNIYGIFKKMAEGYQMKDIHDLHNLKIMVDSEANCYQSLGLIHQRYNPVNNKFKDFICCPKPNMYRSLHTTVYSGTGQIVQTQIRTFDMDKVASFGLATYWNLNKGNARHNMQHELKERCQFMKSLMEINQMFSDNTEFVNHVKQEVFTDNIFVYTPNGDRIELPKGATLIDFAYRIHTNIGNTMIGGFVNDEFKNVDYILRNNDRVRIVTDNLAYPIEEWVDKAQTSLARRKIKESIK